MALTKVEVWPGREQSRVLRDLPLDADRPLTTREKLQQAAIDLEAGRKTEARLLLEEVVQANPRSERGWLWLADAVNVEEERRFCLTQVVSINHRNALARRGLEAIGQGAIQSPLLRVAFAALQVGRREEARHLLEGVVQANPRSERGWLWLADAVDSYKEQRFCLTQVISINRRNALARRRLEVLGPGSARSPLGGQAIAAPGLWTGQQSSVAVAIGERAATASRSIPLAVPIAAGYLSAVAVAEVLTHIVGLQVRWVGVVLHVILLMVLLIHTARIWGRPGHRLLLCLSFAPLIRLLDLTVPFIGFPRIYWFLIISVPLGIAAAIALPILGFSRMELGLNLRALPIQALVVFTGLSLGYIEYLILQRNPMIQDPMIQSLAWKDVWQPVLILVVCTGFLEELIFRGMMQQAVTRVLGAWWGVIYVAALFAVLHVGHQSLLDVIFVFIVALFFGAVKAHTGSILGVTLAHGLTNVLLFLTLPLGVNHFDLLASYLSRF
jgi:membrane protease YdiL (CAAX protease family)